MTDSINDKKGKSAVGRTDAVFTQPVITPPPSAESLVKMNKMLAKMKELFKKSQEK